MKLISLSAVLIICAAALVSCESTHSRKAGGAAFSDSHLARQLDANIPPADPENPRAASYDQWRENR